MNSSVSWRVSLSCSGRLSFNLLRSLFSFPPVKEENWSVRLLPKWVSSLASCTTTFCLCKSCQRTLSSCPLPCGVYHRFSESECKGTAFFRTDKIFREIFSENHAFSRPEWPKSREIDDIRKIWAEHCGNERGKTNSAQGRKERPYRKVKVTIRSFLKLYLIKAIPEVGIVLCRLSPW